MQYTPHKTGSEDGFTEKLWRFISSFISLELGFYDLNLDLICKKITLICARDINTNFPFVYYSNGYLIYRI